MKRDELLTKAKAVLGIELALVCILLAAAAVVVLTAVADMRATAPVAARPAS
ncbi:MAG TPA: hypothetical protein VFW47_08440 [Phenylobacterium sp.]|nr:hypothetical protein [Phenylobacterium sp.]